MTSIAAGELVAPALAKAGVGCVFALNGAHVQQILEGCLDHGIQLIDMRHEAAAGHAAEGYARAGRRLGVAVVTAGPGFTNVLTSLANAYIDRTPVLYLAGGAPLAGAERNVLQSGIDQVALAKPIAKWAHRVTVASDVPRLLAHAVRIATSAPTGPVFLEIPWDLMLAPVDTDPVGAAEPTLPAVPCAPAAGKIDAALALLRAASKPAIMVGVDVYRSGACDDLRRFAETSSLPVFTEYEALGALPGEHPLWMGTLFQLARLPADHKPDVVLALGIRFGWNAPGFDREFAGKIIHVDTDPVEIGRLNTPAIGVVADSREALQMLNGRAAAAWPERSAWLGTLHRAMQEIRAEASAAKGQNTTRPHPVAAAQVVCEAARNAILVADGAFSKHWMEDVVRRGRPGCYFSHGSFGAMGIGLGVAIGAKMARPDEPVLCVSGDGAAGFTIAEFDTMVRHRLPIVVVVMNNHSWGAVDPARHPDGSNRPAGIRLGQARYDEIAKAFGGRGQYVTRLDELKAAIEAGFASGLPTCINVEVDMGGLPPAFKAATLGLPRRPRSADP